MSIDTEELKEVRKARLQAVQEMGANKGLLWIHVKTGNRYWVRDVVVMENDLSLWVVYRGIGNVSVPWARPMAEFMDGRFVKAPIPEGQQEIKG